MRLTIRYTRPASGTGTAGYTGQDEYSRRWIGWYFRTPTLGDTQLAELIRTATYSEHTVEVLPHPDGRKPVAPECEAF